MNIFTELGRFILMLKDMFSKPENLKMYWKEFMHQCVEIGIRSLGIVVIISVFMGAVSALQTAYQLVSPLIPLSTIAQIVRDTVILEFSPTLVCIVLAGVVGSKIAGELGNMRVSEQIDALEIMGINTKTYLILPKIRGCHDYHSDAGDYFGRARNPGGKLAAVGTGIVSTSQFDKGLFQYFKPFNVLFALVKSYCFAFIISSISSFYGYYVNGGALEIGRASTKSVVVVVY